MRRSFRTLRFCTYLSPGFHPGLVCAAPLGQKVVVWTYPQNLPSTTHRPPPTAYRRPSMVHGSSSRRSMNVLWLAFEVPRWGRGLSSGLHSEPPQRGRGWCCGLICCHSHGNLRVALRAAVWSDGPEDGPERWCRETVWRGRDPLQDCVASPISSSAQEPTTLRP